MEERRKSRRYQLSEIVVFSCERPDGEVVQMTGVTHDLSAGGIAFVSTSDVEVGARITLDLFLQPVIREHREIQLHAEGFVLRTQPLGQVGNRITAAVTFQEEPEGMFVASSAQ
jgi:PilZ domain